MFEPAQLTIVYVLKSVANGSLWSMLNGSPNASYNSASGFI